jgi:hypothetical protein
MLETPNVLWTLIINFEFSWISITSDKELTIGEYSMAIDLDNYLLNYIIQLEGKNSSEVLTSFLEHIVMLILVN